jgi:acyl-CoA synthetase (NDP forming)
VTHSLDPLLKPKSTALLGASEREGSPGRVLAELVLKSGFCGKVFPVNPRNDSILGSPCYPGLEALPETAEHVVSAVSNEKMEQASTTARRRQQSTQAVCLKTIHPHPLQNACNRWLKMPELQSAAAMAWASTI